MIHTVSLITSSGRTLSVKAAGEGPPLVLLHGFPLDHRLWLPLFQRMQDHYHCIAPELRGFGGSTLDGGYSLADLAADVESVRVHFAGNQPIHLVGLSMGGYVAFEYWHRFGQYLASMTLANTKPGSDDDQARAGRHQMASEVSTKGVMNVIEPMLERLIAPPARGTSIEKNLREIVEAIRPESIAAAQRAMADRKDFTSFLPSLRLPTLVVTGEYDSIAPPEPTKQWADQIPQSEYHAIAGAGHLSPLEKPDEFYKILSGFLTQTIRDSGATRSEP